MAIKKQRLDQLLAQHYPQYSRRQLQSWIMQGKVSVDDKIITKPGVSIVHDAIVVLKAEKPKYVSRAGFKLEKALDHFAIDVRELIALDAGISTGGFTDCLLQRGIKKVYGVDVGYGQVHEKIRNNERLVLLERTNLRTLKSIDDSVDLVTLDLSFISVLKVMDAVVQLMKPDGQLVILIKPQFEAERHEIGRGGIIKDPEVHQKVIKKITDGITKYGFTCVGVIESPIKGATGNKEFLGYFKRIV